MRGYFGIGIYSPKTSYNIGTLWRSAYQLGASFIFTINKRYKKERSDTLKTYRHVPLFQFETIDDFYKSRIYDCQLVCIDFGEKSIPLPEFQHPQRAVYLLGSEDNGLPKEFKHQKLLSIPSIRTQSYNVSVAGSIIMYDRFCKTLIN